MILYLSEIDTKVLIDTKIYYYYVLLNLHIIDYILLILFINDKYIATLLFACILLNL